jgi:UDP-N-acetylmuramoylalanine--D-glutamate ligase
MQYDIIILGSGESGVGAAKLAVQQGLSVFVSDGGTIKDAHKAELDNLAIAYEEGAHTAEIILSGKEIIKSPGIGEKAEIVKAARAANVPIISEIEFGYRYKGDSKIVAITGSNGKTTTTSLTYHIFSNAGYDVSMCGNIGKSFARQIAEEPTQWYIIEVSSFQLDDIKNFKPNIAVLLNITPDHLDRYEYQFANYVASKFRIAMNQSNDDFFIVNADDETIMDKLNQISNRTKILYFTMDNTNKDITPSATVKDMNLHIDVNGELISMPTSELNIPGQHNLYNSMASGISARLAEIRKEKVRDAFGTFNSLEHRLEVVANVKGVTYVNDSKATNMNSVWYALESVKTPIVLILGGVDKGNDYDEIMELVKNKVKSIICLGLDNSKIHEAFGTLNIPIVDADSAKAAVEHAYALSERGDTVLLSPACASFDLFRNYEDRGTQFKEAVKSL